MTLSENAAYLNGLADGLDLDESKPEGKLLKKLLALVADMAEKVDQLDDESTELRDYIEELDDDLAVLEDDVYGDNEEEDDEGDEDDGDEDFYEVTCPHCGEPVCFDDSIDPENITCPACGETFDCTCDGDCTSCGGCGEQE